MNEHTTVLIVEDEVIAAFVLQKNLEQLGYRVCGVARDGQEAVRLALAEKPAVILMDVRLSGSMDGIDAALQIRTRLRSPIVFMTGFLNEAREEVARGIEAAVYLVKPVRVGEIVQAIENLLAGTDSLNSSVVGKNAP